MSRAITTLLFKGIRHTAKSEQKLCLRTSIARLRKRNGIPSYTAKRVEDGVAPAPIRNLVGDQLRRHAVPAFFVEKTPFIVFREVPVALRVVLVVITSGRAHQENLTTYIFEGARGRCPRMCSAERGRKRRTFRCLRPILLSCVSWEAEVEGPVQVP